VNPPSFSFQTSCVLQTLREQKWKRPGVIAYSACIINRDAFNSEEYGISFPDISGHGNQTHKQMRAISTGEQACMPPTGVRHLSMLGMDSQCRNLPGDGSFMAPQESDNLIEGMGHVFGRLRSAELAADLRKYWNILQLRAQTRVVTAETGTVVIFVAPLFYPSSVTGYKGFIGRVSSAGLPDAVFSINALLPAGYA
jgi:hypothetical protein